MFRQESRRPAWRREVRPEAALDARKPVRRSSVGGRSLGRQEARLEARPERPEAVWDAKPPESQNASFSPVLLQNAGFAQGAGRAQAAGRRGPGMQSHKIAKPDCITFL